MVKILSSNFMLITPVRPSFQSWCRAAVLSASFLLISFPAFAGLGQDVSSVDADQVQMQGARQMTQAATYAVHEIKAPTGTVVREYVSASGKVFGVAWQGPWPPDMRQILADYFETYRQATAAEVSSHAGRRPLIVNLPEVVIQSGGHMRSFNGRAFVPALLPNGVSPEIIR
jgi:hypothetical protein